METKPFSFKHVSKGAPIEPSAVPLCPPTAVTALFAWRRNYPLEGLVAPEAIAEAYIDLACAISLTVLRRLDSTITLEDILNDEESREIVRLFHHIEAANPSIFPQVPEA